MKLIENTAIPIALAKELGIPEVEFIAVDDGGWEFGIKVGINGECLSTITDNKHGAYGRVHDALVKIYDGKIVPRLQIFVGMPLIKVAELEEDEF